MLCRRKRQVAVMQVPTGPISEHRDRTGLSKTYLRVKIFRKKLPTLSRLPPNHAFRSLVCHNRKSLSGRHPGVKRTSLETPVVVNVGPHSSAMTSRRHLGREAAGARLHLPEEVSPDLCAACVPLNDKMTFPVRNGDAEIYNLFARIPSGPGGSAIVAVKEGDCSSQRQPTDYS